jgi:phosphoglycolate phosphatase
VSDRLRLVVFDVDGTLVDSQADIISCMNAAFAGLGQPLPARSDVLALVGLSLDVLMPQLAPDVTPAQHSQLIEAYKDAYMTRRRTAGTVASSPLYEGAMDCLHRLNAMPDVLLGVATGKSKRGLDKLIEGHGLEGLFVTQQVADFHPSKPHPAMLHTAMAEAGVEAADAIMVGDTSFDMDMAASAGMRAIGVNWGYHSPEKLQAATRLVDRFDQLEQTLSEMWSDQV